VTIYWRQSASITIERYTQSYVQVKFMLTSLHTNHHWSIVWIWEERYYKQYHPHTP